MVFDLQILTPGKVPRFWLEKSVSTLRAVGAHSFAERLDRTREGPWRALETFFKRPSRQGRDFGDLFATAGYFEARLEWRHQGTIEVLVPGRGGSRELKAGKSGGELLLSASSVDPVVRTLFALAVREFEPATSTSDRVSSRVRGILGESEVLLRALERLDRLADSDVPVLIQGETGTGKELAARQLHNLSARSPQPLVTVNCAALSDTLLLSDLFGHVRGAFTGADRDRAGVFESARGGTVLLDEIGDLPMPAQGKLLRVLQEGEVRRVGESLPRQIDIRIVAATHQDLRSMVEERGFRADLFYRLSVGCLTLPPLRNRERDVLVLADHFVERSGHTLTPRARRRLLGYTWPGNVRELINVLQVAMALGTGSIIDLPDLELPNDGSRRGLGYHQQVEDFRRDLVREALAASGGQRSAAARRLELSRQALSYLVRRFGLR
jgi:transcriptional regulator with GAF, ATPase, and Fis domain